MPPKPTTTYMQSTPPKHTPRASAPDEGCAVKNRPHPTLLMLPGVLLGKSHGNSRADLQLTRLGFEFSALIVDESWSTTDAASWIESNLCQFTICSQRP